MDLHFIPGAVASAREREAVDAGIARPAARNDLGKRHLLLPALRAVQGREGWISEGALNYICERLEVPPAEAYGVASFYALLTTTRRPGMVAHVCDDIACRTRGAAALCATLRRRLGPPGEPALDGRATWVPGPCLGLCEQAPAVFFQAAGEPFLEWTAGHAQAEEASGP